MASSRRKARRAALTQKRPPRQQPKSRRCEETGKLGYRSKIDALTVLSRASRKGAQRTYLCGFCNRWHLTKQPKRGGDDG